MVDRQPKLPVRVRIALVLLLVATLLPLRGPAGTLAAFLKAGGVPRDAITAHELRLAPVRDALLALGATRVGYLARSDLRGDLQKRLADPHYIWTCYALAPVMVLPDTYRPIVFADLAVEPGGSGSVPEGFEVMQRFDDSLLLLRPGAQ